MAWTEYYAKLKAGAKLMNRPVSRVKLGRPEVNCECPACDRKRRTWKNWWRRLKTRLPPEPPLNLPVVKNCPCPACVKRRKRRKVDYQRRRARMETQ